MASSVLVKRSASLADPDALSSDDDYFSAIVSRQSMKEEMDFSPDAFPHGDDSNVSTSAIKNNDNDGNHSTKISENAMNNNNNSNNNDDEDPKNDAKATQIADNNLSAEAMTNRHLFYRAAQLTGKIGPMKTPQNKIILLDFLIQKARQDPSSFPLTMERGHATTRWSMLAHEVTARFAENQSLVSSNTAAPTFTGIKLRLCVNAIGNCLSHVRLDEFHGTEQFWLMGEESVEFKLWAMSDICKATRKQVGHVDKKAAKEPIAMEPGASHLAVLPIEGTKEAATSTAPSRGTMLGTRLSLLQAKGSITMEEMNLGITRLSSDASLIEALLALDEIQQTAYIVGLKQ